ncbi:NUDIX hydrolase [Dactylosporangium sp. CA-092794]|uniref:NUDIX hydrolase n=1 Tax=Dactylosporangium sp. CA-092794 TaxID=3239929 RepID=UPI003D8CD25A
MRQEFSIVYTARPLGGEPTPSDESREVVWVSPDAIDGLTMHRSMRMRIEHYLTRAGKPHLG